MKNILMLIFAIAFSIMAKADPVSVSTGKKTFKTYDDLLAADVNAAEKLLRVYMEDSMRCTRVRLDGNVIKQDGLFSSGIFVLKLTADCDSSITNVKIDFDPLCSAKNGGEAALLFQYAKSGQLISKRFIVHNSASCQE